MLITCIAYVKRLNLEAVETLKHLPEIIILGQDLLVDAEPPELSNKLPRLILV